MKPHEDYANGDDPGAASEDSSDSEGAPEHELSLHDPGAPARALAALNALRKSRQHYDTLLLAGGAELPAHRAVLAACSPHLLRALHAAAPGAALRVDVDPDALRALLEWAYTGRARVRDAAAARRLYCAAWRLRVEPVRAALAERLLRRLAPGDVLDARALPGLAPPHRAALDDYIAHNFDAVCAAGALAALPLLRIEMLRETSAEGGDEKPLAVADAALVWLRDQQAADVDLEELCSRTHLLYVDGRGALRDCGELPAARGDAPELQEYRRECAERGRARRGAAEDAPAAELDEPPGEREAPPACAVLAARSLGGGARVTRALLALRGRLAAARIAWRDVGGGGVARGGVLGGARAAVDGAARARLLHGRCALGAAALGGRLVVCGGYDRARVLRAAEAYDPLLDEWRALPDMKGARARFPAAVLGGTLLAVGGSDGHSELDSVAALEDGRWAARARLPLALSHAAAAVDEPHGELYVVGGWAGGLSLKRVLKYDAEADAWTEGPPLNAGRSQCAAAFYRGALWALGGCSSWHCLASTERLAGPGPAGAAGAWAPGPALPTARRSMGAAAWRDRLVSVGGSDGAASLRRTEVLEGEGWRAGPELRRPRAALGLVVLHDALYAVGGFDGKEFLACVECLYELDGEWTTLRDPPSPALPVGDCEPADPPREDPEPADKPRDDPEPAISPPKEPPCEPSQ